jgi:hypothetical protein
MMNFRLVKLLPVVVAAYFVAGCDPDISGSSRDPDAGRADFSTFVAIGDSLTAGYADGALYKDGQLNSFPAIMAQQFALVGGGAFTQPLMRPEKTGSLFFTVVDLMRSDRLVLVATGNPKSPAAPVEITPSISSDVATEADPGLYNNIGVPGAKIFHAPAAGYGNPAGLGTTANPYFIRFANDQGASSMLSDAMAQNPSFFTLWLGNNDLLLYALDGADATVSGESVTALGTMTAKFDELLLGLKTVNNKGVLINIPDITTIPYFNTVPYNPIELDSATASGLNLAFQSYNDDIAASALTPEKKAERTIHFVEGLNPVLILDEYLDIVGVQPKIRLATAKDYIVLPASRKIGVDSGGMYGVSVPLVDADVLTKDEVTLEIDAVRNLFNDHVEAEAAGNPDLLLLDAEALLVELDTTGILYGSGGISSTFAQGGGFSLDGVHPTARGYAVIANEIFKVINEGFDAYIPPVDPSDYPTVFYQ